MPRAILDCHSRSDDPIAKALSNFTERLFFVDGVLCGSMEGFLQSLKFEDLEEQLNVAQLAGYRAFKRGQTKNTWKIKQVLYWRGLPIPRDSLAYQELLTRAYDAQFEQSDLRTYLKASVGKVLRHTMGKHDTHDSVLTESEYVRQLDRLRWRALDE